MLSVTDPRGIVSTTEYDSRGQVTVRLAAAGTAVEARSETDYDSAGNMIEVRAPRYFDASDTGGYQLAKTNLYWNGRDLPMATAQVLNASDLALSETEYTLDGRVSRTIDPRAKVWECDWHACCGRLQGTRDPAGHGTFSNADHEGNVTHTADVSTYDSHSNPHDPVYALTLRERTTRYDLLQRPVMQCLWLVPRGAVDPYNPPIAGLDADGNGQIDGSTAQGLPRLTVYDSNLADGVGLDSATGIALRRYYPELAQV